MANVRGKSIDNTHLSIDQAEARGFIHRDYIAHCMRWTLVANRLQKSYKTARVLDVGCGVDIPLAKLLYSSKLIVDQYVGIDYNSPDKLKMGPFHSGRFPIRAFGGIDFISEQVEIDEPSNHYSVMNAVFLRPTVVTCFEVLEHVEPSHSVKILAKIRDILAPGGLAYISTPCYDTEIGAAGNHVNEMRRDALGAVIENLGFEITENFGTFASQRDYRDKMFKEYPDMVKVWDRLKQYYDSNYMATIFAPMYAAFARNNLWVLRVAKPGYVRKFGDLESVPKPWTSSSRWEELAESEHD